MYSILHFFYAHRKKTEGEPINRCFIKNDFCERSESLKSSWQSPREPPRSLQKRWTYIIQSH